MAKLPHHVQCYLVATNIRRAVYVIAVLILVLRYACADRVVKEPVKPRKYANPAAVAQTALTTPLDEFRDFMTRPR